MTAALWPWLLLLGLLCLQASATECQGDTCPSVDSAVGSPVTLSDAAAAAAATDADTAAASAAYQRLRDQHIAAIVNRSSAAIATINAASFDASLRLEEAAPDTRPASDPARIADEAVRHRLQNYTNSVNQLAPLANETTRSFLWMHNRGAYAFNVPLQPLDHWEKLNGPWPLLPGLPVCVCDSSSPFSPLCRRDHPPSSGQATSAVVLARPVWLRFAVV